MKLEQIIQDTTKEDTTIRSITNLIHNVKEIRIVEFIDELYHREQDTLTSREYRDFIIKVETFFDFVHYAHIKASADTLIIDGDLIAIVNTDKGKLTLLKDVAQLETKDTKRGYRAKIFNTLREKIKELYQ